MKPEIKIFENTGEIADEFAQTLIEIAKKAKGKAVHIALSGGSTPKAIFQFLTDKYKSQLAHQTFHFWWGDDRCVAPTDDDSNYKWANQLWLKPIGIPIENIHRVMGENAPTEEALRYSKEISEQVPLKNGLPVFDLMLLGLGEDGHTASIFPHQMEFLTSPNICEVATHPDSGQQRITLTGSVINQSKLIAFLAVGEKKSSKVAEVVQQKKQKLPATNIRAIEGKLIWWLDKTAASRL